MSKNPCIIHTKFGKISKYFSLDLLQTQLLTFLLTCLFTFLLTYIFILENIKPGSWLAFGYGSYNCIGKKFALNEMKMGVAKILQNFEIEVDMDKRSFRRSIRISVCANPPVIVRIKPLNKNYEKKNN